MGFREGSFATVWEISNMSERFAKIRISTSRKDKDGEYFTDFNGFVALVGDAFKKVSKIEEALEHGDRARIKLGPTDTTNTYKKDEGREYVNYTLFDFEMAGSALSSGNSASAKNEKSNKAPAKSATKKGTRKAAGKKAAPSLDDEDGSTAEDGADTEDEDLPV